MQFKIIMLMLTIIIISSCAGINDRTEIITISGSDTMLKLSKYLAQEYMRLHPNVAVYVNGGGTAKGVRAITKGTADICTASRTLTSEEIKLIADKYSVMGVSFRIAKDALSIYINRGNPVREFTTAQLNDIFTCKITNWKQLGGANQAIVPIIRNMNSGTQLYFRRHVMNDAGYCERAVVKSTTNSVIQAVSENPNAIGYGGLQGNESLINAKVDGYEASEYNIRNDLYPITRYHHFFTAGSPDAKSKKFIDWVISPVGQKAVKAAGCLPLYRISH